MRTSSRTILLAGLSSLAVAAFAATLASAAPQGDSTRPDPGTRMMDTMDANKDGVLTLEEFQAGGTERFGRMDKNGDGFLEPGEGRPDEAKGEGPKGPMAGKGGHHRDNPDTDGDGRVSAQEHTAAASAMFARADTNKDGYLDDKDERPHGMKGPMGPMGPERDAKAPRPTPDTDGDGKVSREEAAAMDARLFARLDRDGNGEVTKDEMAAGRGPHRAPGGPSKAE
ncbi:MAG: EF-hand domain-containing protein [Alphaproteobacteria bacterium]|nr:EF-hand domain-containing protein [Alphaproteobacteria bacterium]